MVETAGVVVKFSHAWVTLVNGGVLSESTLRLAYPSTLCTDPGARGGHLGWGEEGERSTWFSEFFANRVGSFIVTLCHSYWVLHWRTLNDHSKTVGNILASDEVIYINV